MIDYISELIIIHNNLITILNPTQKYIKAESMKSEGYINHGNRSAVVHSLKQ
jgi:hypothetical protein